MNVEEPKKSTQNDEDPIFCAWSNGTPYLMRGYLTRRLTEYNFTAKACFEEGILHAIGDAKSRILF